jgi:hypothetical protein
VLRLSTTFHKHGSVREFIKRLASLANVNGYFSIAGVHNIHIFEPCIPTIPAVSPLGTVKYRQNPLREARGMWIVGTIP